MYKKHFEAQTLNARAVLKSLLTVKSAIPTVAEVTNKLVSEILDLQKWHYRAHAIYLQGTIKQASNAFDQLA